MGHFYDAFMVLLQPFVLNYLLKSKYVNVYSTSVWVQACLREITDSHLGKTVFVEVECLKSRDILLHFSK